MAYSDPSVGIATRIQTTQGVPLGGFGALSYNNYYRVISVDNVSGNPTWDQEDTINTAMTAQPPKSGKIQSTFTMRMHMTVARAIKELAACIGAVTSGSRSFTIQVAAGFATLTGDHLTVIIDGTTTTFEFVAGAPVGDQIQVGASAIATATNITAAVTALTGVTATSGGTDTVTVTLDDGYTALTCSSSDAAQPGEIIFTGAAAYGHIITPSATAANTRRFTMQFDVNGRIYTHVDCEPLGFSISAADKFLDLELQMGSRYVSHVQHIPTNSVGPATYSGVVFTHGAYSGADTAAATYTIECTTSGSLTTGACYIRSRIAAGTWSDPRPVYLNVPWEIRNDDTEASSGIYLIFTSGANNDLASGGPDTWTVSTRGTVAAPTITSNTVFSWNTEEFTRLWYNGSAFTISPKTFSHNYDRGLSTSDFVGGSRVVASYDRERHAVMSGRADVRVRDATLMNAGWNNSQRSMQIRAEGQRIGSTDQLERVDFSFPQIRIKPITESMDGAFLKYFPIEFQAHASTSVLDDFYRVVVYNSISSLTT